MNKLFVAATALLGCLLLCGCGSGGSGPSLPTEAMAQRAIQDSDFNADLEREYLRIASIRKIDGTRMEKLGVPCYEMKCEVVFEVLKDYEFKFSQGRRHLNWASL